MPGIKDILKNSNAEEKINALKHKTVKVPQWSVLGKILNADKHDIVSDGGRKDRRHSDGTVDKAARLTYGIEELLVHRMNQFMFSLPVLRTYKNADDKNGKIIVKAMEGVYDHVHINTVNMERGLKYFKSCEIFTIWYTVKEKNTFYGFPCDYKLKCKTYSPDEGYELYPLFDDMGDMVAMSIGYVKEEEGKDTEYFETYTADEHLRWKRTDGAWDEDIVTNDDEDAKKLGKIPGVYISRDKAVYDLVPQSRGEMEYKMSENSDTLSYNSSPILMVAGKIQGEDRKGEGRKVYRVENGGNIGYVSWNQSIEALKYHVSFSKEMVFLQTQMPDISFENMKGLGDVGYDARQLMFMDTYLKIGEESKPFEEFLTREANIIKRFLELMNVSLEGKMDEIIVVSEIQPFMLPDLKHKVEVWKAANGDKPLTTHRESVIKAGLADDADKVVAEYEKEMSESIEGRMDSIFGGGSAE